MESLMYNVVDKQLVIIFGYGIGNHLSVNFLKGYTKDIKKLLPELTTKKLNTIKFLEVDRSSRRHRYMWYCRIDVDLSHLPSNEHYLQLNGKSVYKIDKKVDETAADCMNRMIHD